MAVKKQLSSDQIGAIVALHKVGKSQRQIAKQLELSQSTVNLWLSRHNSGDASGTPVRKIGSGRPRKTNLRTDKLLKRTVLIKPQITAKEIKSEHRNLLKDVSERTIRHRLQKELGLPSRHAAKKPFLNAKMRKKREFVVDTEAEEDPLEKISSQVTLLQQEEDSRKVESSPATKRFLDEATSSTVKGSSNKRKLKFPSVSPPCVFASKPSKKISDYPIPSSASSSLASLEKPSESLKEDEHDIFASHVANKLRSLTSDNSRRLAKLQIQKVLFEF